MPSSRMGRSGELGFGFSHLPPYQIYSLRSQLFDFLEVSANYRIFRGIEDPVLSPHGFGDFSDKGANVKLSLIRPEDSGYELPGFSVGFEDFIGTRAFKSNYVVLTQVWLRANAELSLGWGSQRINGLFGGLSWMPWRKSSCNILNPLAFILEYDATDYRHKDPHPKGRKRSSHWNAGLKYRLGDIWDFSFEWIRGREFAVSTGVFYNFGETEGLLPKLDDPLPYHTPKNLQPIGQLRSEFILIQDLIFAFQDQGIDLLKAEFGEACSENRLFIHLYNRTWLLECEFMRRVSLVLSSLLPRNLSEVIVIVECEGFPSHALIFKSPFLEYFREREISFAELAITTPRREINEVNFYPDKTIFKKDPSEFCWSVKPRLYMFFGSSTGKFKYAAGLNFCFQGLFENLFYYDFLFGYTFITKLGDVGDVDRLNPSQLINVHTDIVNYYKKRGLSLERGYLQKTWNLGSGFFWRISGGVYSLMYGGGGVEGLYYPADGNWAIGVEGAILKRRKTSGLAFSNKIRKLKGFRPTFRKFLGSQAFLDFYYNLLPLQVDLKLSVGKFLANDTGVRGELSRYFSNGFKLWAWYTITTGHDRVNGRVYYDKGIGIGVPLEFFYTSSSLDRWNYSISAWLRDVGFREWTGKSLWQELHDVRNSYY